jgi:hypothetical protein
LSDFLQYLNKKLFSSREILERKEIIYNRDKWDLWARIVKVITISRKMFVNHY